MRFYFVDKIDKMTDNEIYGSVKFDKNAPQRFKASDGNDYIAPGIISEAIGQLASWLAMDKNSFTGRPVFLFGDEIALGDRIEAGSNIDLYAKFEKIEEDNFIFSGYAESNGRRLCSITNVSGMMMPLAEMEDPEFTKKRFENLTTTGSGDEDSGESYPFENLIGEVKEKKDFCLEGEKPSGNIIVEKSFSANEPFYKHHFPRKPITPIVMINETIGQCASNLICKRGETLKPLAVKNIKIKNFITPDTPAIFEVKVTGFNKGNGKTIVDTVTQIELNGKKILRGKYQYEVLKND